MAEPVRPPDRVETPTIDARHPVRLARRGAGGPRREPQRAVVERRPRPLATRRLAGVQHLLPQLVGQAHLGPRDRRVHHPVRPHRPAHLAEPARLRQPVAAAAERRALARHHEARLRRVRPARLRHARVALRRHRRRHRRPDPRDPLRHPRRLLRRRARRDAHAVHEHHARHPRAAAGHGDRRVRAERPGSGRSRAARSWSRSCSASPAGRARPSCCERRRGRCAPASTSPPPGSSGEKPMRIIFVEILPNLRAAASPRSSSSASSSRCSARRACPTSASARPGRSRSARCSTTRRPVRPSARGAWWWFVPPGLVIALLGAGLSLINFAIDEVVDPEAAPRARRPRARQRQATRRGDAASRTRGAFA